MGGTATTTRESNARAASLLGHSRPGPAGRCSSHVRYAPKATVGHQNAIGRDGPFSDSGTAAKQVLFDHFISSYQ
jgi:hypothetical protein